MFKKSQNSQLTIVELTEDVKVSTAIASANQPALRSGFAGYPVNPRWGAGKYRAWKTGRDLRESLQQGKLIVRASDSMLVMANSTPKNRKPRFFKRTKIEYQKVLA